MLDSKTIFDCGGGLELIVHSTGETFVSDATTGAEICLGYLSGPCANRTEATNLMKAIAQVLDATRQEQEIAA